MSHVTRSRWFGFVIGMICTLALVVALGSVTGVWAGTLAQDPQPPDQEATGPAGPDGMVTRAIPVQGRLTNASGSPINGARAITFTLYTASLGGTVVCQDMNPVGVVDGLFSSSIDTCTAEGLNGQALWLGIWVHGEAAEMTPRQPIYPVPYAFSLVPGAQIGGTGTGNGSLSLNDSTGAEMIGLTASSALLDLGGIGEAGDLYVRNISNTVTFKADGSTGDVSQALAADGLVKAAVYAFCTSTGANNLHRSFSQVSGAGAITLINGATGGQCTIDFGFDVSDRYVVVTANYNGARSVTYLQGSTNNRLDFDSWDAAGTNASGNIMVLIY